MIKRKAVKLLINEDSNNCHSAVISKLMRNAKFFECAVAFAKLTGLGSIMPGLERGLALGLKARIVVGLSLYLTDPGFLRKLLYLQEKFQDTFTLYVNNSSDTFHPKIYAISGNNRSTVLIGSANLTAGGMLGNYEASAQIDDSDNKLFQAVVKHLDALIDSNEIVKLTHARLQEYEQQHNISKMQQKLAKLRFNRMAQAPNNNVILETLRDYLTEMKLDSSDNGFKMQMNSRSKCLNAAAFEISAIAAVDNINSALFLEHYERLIQYFHSGGLHRGKNIIAENPLKFQSALKDLLKSKPESPQDAYEILQRHFCEIPRAGINVLTEILHAIDSQKFVVMNQNAVYGLRLANYTNYPEKPSKNSVNAAMYANFCRDAAEIRDQLGLTDFTELDALFNYAYW